MVAPVETVYKKSGVSKETRVSTESVPMKIAGIVINYYTWHYKNKQNY